MKKDCGMWINILSHKLKKRMNADMRNLGITGVQSRVMHYIFIKYTAGPVFQRDVENAFGFNRSTATGILQLMEKNGLILRESAAGDARLKSLIPTEKAVLLEEQIDQCLRRTEKCLTWDLSQAQLASFLETAECMSVNLDG